MSKPKKSSKPGPKEERVKIDDDWEEAVKKVLKKQRPAKGWPKPDDDSHSPAASDDSEDN